MTLHRPVERGRSRGNSRGSSPRSTALDYPLVFPVHPRTRKVMTEAGLWRAEAAPWPNLHLVDPLGYDEFLNLTMHAGLVVTDSGGIQEETTYLGIPCLTLRPNTERPITITEGTNELATVATLPALAADAIAGRWKSGRIPELWDGAHGAADRRRAGGSFRGWRRDQGRELNPHLAAADSIASQMKATSGALAGATAGVVRRTTLRLSRAWLADVNITSRPALSRLSSTRPSLPRK